MTDITGTTTTPPATLPVVADARKPASPIGVPTRRPIAVFVVPGLPVRR